MEVPGSWLLPYDLNLSPVLWVNDTKLTIIICRILFLLANLVVQLAAIFLLYIYIYSYI